MSLFIFLDDINMATSPCRLLACKTFNRYLIPKGPIILLLVKLEKLTLKITQLLVSYKMNNSTEITMRGKQTLGNIQATDDIYFWARSITIYNIACIHPNQHSTKYEIKTKKN